MPVSRFAPVLLSAVGFAAPALAAPRAAVISSDPNAGANVRNVLIARGFAVDQLSFVPSDLTPYCCVWDIQPFDPIPTPVVAQYLAYLQDGHGLYLSGEHTGCCTGRDFSIRDAINLDFVGGPVSIVNDRPGTFEELADPFNPVTQTPNVINKITLNGIAVGIFESFGTGDILTQDLGHPSLAAVSWKEGSLAGAPDGRLAVVLDVNWLTNSFAFTDNAAFLENLSYFLCPTTTAGMSVTITTPPFNLECPADIDVTGTVDGSGAGGDCVQPTTLAPTTLPALQRDPTALAGLTLDAPGDDLKIAAAPLLAPDPEPIPDRLSAGIITAVEVSVNGGPFTPVSSTLPALPAPPPVSFTAAGLPLTLGANTIVVRATDDLTSTAEASLTGNVADTIPPAIDLGTCAMVQLPLDATCQATFNALPTATDACDPAPTWSTVPPIPHVFAAPGVLVFTHTVTDQSGNKESCDRTVSAEDKTPPTLNCVVPLKLECSAQGGNPQSDPLVSRWLAATTAADNCSVASLVHNAPPLFPSACPPGHGTTVDWSAIDGSGNPAACSSTLTVEDSKAPSITAVPAPLALECSTAGGVPASTPAVQAWLATFTAADLCSATVTLGNNVPALIPSGCAPGKVTSVTFEAADSCANKATASQNVTVVDSTAPTLTVPANLTLECNGSGGVLRSDPAIQAWLATATRSDICGSTIIANNAPALFPSGCGAGFTTTVTFSATDNCGNLSTKTATLTVRDTTAPALSVPPPLLLECNGPGGVPRSDPAVLAWLASATASDLCDGATITSNAPLLFPSGCGAGFTTTVTFTATDNCGNLSTKTATVTVRDTTVPVLSVPPPLLLECNSPGGVPRSDPQIQAWLALASASDVCDGATLSNDAPALFASGCAPGTTTVVTFKAVDNCGNAAQKTATVTVQDTIPPVVKGNTIDGICLWPPNHNFYCIDDVSVGVEAEDICDPTGVAIRVLDCKSSQPEDDTGDGHFAPDCVRINGDRGICVRSERQGGDPAGRIYTITLGASDGCNNSTGFDVRIVVPHDASPAVSCRRPNAGKDIPPKK